MAAFHSIAVLNCFNIQWSGGIELQQLIDCMKFHSKIYTFIVFFLKKNVIEFDWLRIDTINLIQGKYVFFFWSKFPFKNMAGKKSVVKNPSKRV